MLTRGRMLLIPDQNENRRWELADQATLYDVTHLACRSARYTPATGYKTFPPANVGKPAIAVAPGGIMPAIEGCRKQDYAGLFVIAVAVAADGR
ncbi:hypothetical protein [Nitrospira sp. Ecomares 2.1]